MLQMAIEMVKRMKQLLREKVEQTFWRIRIGLEKEGRDTREMIRTYIRFTKGKAGKVEMKKANKQFRDFLKTIGFGVLAVLPLAFITIPLIVKWGKKIGIDIIPKSFKDE